MVDFGEVSGDDEPGVAAQPGYETESSEDGGKEDFDIVRLFALLITYPSRVPSSRRFQRKSADSFSPHSTCRTTSSLLCMHFDPAFFPNLA